MELPEKLHTNKNSCIQNSILPMVSLDYSYSLISGGDIVVVYLLNVVDELDEWWEFPFICVYAVSFKILKESFTHMR